METESYDKAEKNENNADIYILDKDVHALLDMSESAFFVAKNSPDLELIYANRRFYDIGRYTPETFKETFDDKIINVVLETDRQRIRNIMSRQLSMGGKLKLEFKIRRRDDTVAWISLTANLMDYMGAKVYVASFIDITQPKRNLADSQKAKRDTELIANSIPGGLIKVTLPDMQLLYANEGFYRLAGYNREEYLVNFGNYCNKVIYEGDIADMKEHIREVCENNGMLGKEYRINSKAGEIRWSYVSGVRIDDYEGKKVYLCVIMDITSKKRLENRINIEAMRETALARLKDETTWTYDIREKILYRTGNLFYSKSSERVIYDDEWYTGLKEAVHPSQRERMVETIRVRTSTVSEGVDLFDIRRDNGEYVRIKVGSASVSDDGSNVPRYVHGYSRIMSEGIDETLAGDSGLEEIDENYSNNIIEEIIGLNSCTRAMEIDSITGLISYGEFISELKRITAEKKPDEKYAFFCGDIGDFREYEYQYGLSMTNEMLQLFANILKKFVGENGVISRIDRDYFVGMVKYREHRQLLREMSKSMDDTEIYSFKKKTGIEFDTTVGISLFDEQKLNYLDQIERADLARRSLKGMRGNVYCIYTDEIKKQKFVEDMMVDEIYDAMKNQTMEICFLPRFMGEKSNIIGCKVMGKVLLKNGRYAKSAYLQRFIDRGGKLDEFAYYILYQACSTVSAWKTSHDKIIPFSVEMTARQLSFKNVISNIDDIVVTKCGLDREQVTFEIPERYFNVKSEKMYRNIRELRRKGYNITISRFGSDHTEVHTLRDMNANGIKFHGEYFTDVTTSERETIVLKNIVNMAKELGMKVMCGGISTKLQEEYARHIGCEIFDGPMFYGDMRGDVFEEYFVDKCF